MARTTPMKALMAVISLALVAVAIDGVGIFFAKTAADSAARDAAHAASRSVIGKTLTQTVAEAAYAEAVTATQGAAAVLRDAEGTEQDFFISAAGGVTLTVEKEAFSLILRHFGPTKNLTTVRATRTKNPSSL